jgi:hypothetical protein
MIKIETAIKILETVFTYDVGVYAVLVGFILFRMRKEGYNPFGPYAKSSLSLGVDARFLTQLGKRYSEIFEAKKVKVAYEMVLWVGVITFSISFLLAVILAIQH